MLANRILNRCLPSLLHTCHLAPGSYAHENKDCNRVLGASHNGSLLHGHRRALTDTSWISGKANQGYRKGCNRGTCQCSHGMVPEQTCGSAERCIAWWSSRAGSKGSTRRILSNTSANQSATIVVVAHRLFAVSNLNQSSPEPYTEA